VAILVQQFSGVNEVFRERLEALLDRPGLQRVRIAVAFARWDGIGLLSQKIETLLARGARFESVYGAGNGVTTADALYYGIVLQKQFVKSVYAGLVEDKYQNALFHPKFYEFLYNNDRIVLIGSANLTGGGLCRNTETGVELKIVRGPAEKQWDIYWESIKSLSATITLNGVQNLSAKPGAGSEKDEEQSDGKKGKPFLKSKGKTAPKPLFHKILSIKKVSKKKKHDLLGEMPFLTNKPERLYIEVFANETGGSNGNPGNAVQFPVATLGAFFGVQPNEDRQIKIDFADDSINPKFMHLSNNTHRLRIPQIMSVKRPAIMVLQRIGVDHYTGSFAKSFKSTIKEKCDQQSRVGSRRWGFD
jgi:HKD family nuclease